MPFHRRHLPHWHPDQAVFFVTWRLHGTLPRPQLPRGVRLTEGQKFALADRVWDRATSGARWLANPRAADAVAEVLIDSEQHGRCQLWAWCIMPNHCHALVQPYGSLSRLMSWWKGRSAVKVNELLNRAGLPLWQDESYDRWMRNQREIAQTAGYIEMNPVKAGLVEAPEQWRWSSAWSGRERIDWRRATA